MNDETTQGLSRIAIVDSSERHQQSPRVPVRMLDNKIVVVIYKKNAAICKPLIWLISTRLDRDLTANAVRPTDPPDNDAHA